jgi:hypothetical protein
MTVKSIAAALGFVAALTAFSTAPASANASTDTITASHGTAARDDLTTSSYRCSCGYVRYYRVYRVYRVQPVYRVYRVRYYYI